MGLTPKDHSTAGKARLGGIRRAGDELLRSTLVVGATAVILARQRTHGKNASPWLVKLLELEIEAVELKLMEWHRSDECSQRLVKIPGVGHQTERSSARLR